MNSLAFASRRRLPHAGNFCWRTRNSWSVSRSSITLRRLRVAIQQSARELSNIDIFCIGRRNYATEAVEVQTGFGQPTHETRPHMLKQGECTTRNFSAPTDLRLI